MRAQSVHDDNSGEDVSGKDPHGLQKKQSHETRTSASLQVNKASTKQIKWFADKLPVNENSVVLDLCCGTGIVSRHLSPRAKQIHGIDISKHLLDFAKTKAGDNVEYHRADATTLPFPDNTFDVAFTRFSFNHIFERLEVMNEMRRVCKPGGHIALMERVIPDEISDRASILMEHLEETRDHSHVYFMTPAEMNQTFKEHNIEVTTKETTTCSEPFEHYLNQTDLTQKDRDFITQFIHSNILLTDEEDQQITGFYPHVIDDVVFITHHLAMIGGTNPAEKPQKKE